MQTKVSVVVPVYNVEKYLRQCVDSLLAQSLKDIEIILVDDGSPDKCPEIIDEYAKKDTRIIVIHQKNSGYSAAVNKGISLARGKYVGIVESDDFVDPTMFEELYNLAVKGNLEIAKGLFYKYNSSLPKAKQDTIFKNPAGVDLMNAPDKPFSPSEWPAIIAFHASIWSSIYKSTLIKNTLVPETPGASYQDLPFMISLMTKAKKIGVLKKAFYHWRNDPNQKHSTSASGKKLLYMADNTLLSLDILKQSGKYDLLKEGFFAQAYYTNIAFFHSIDKKYKPSYFKKMQEIFHPLLNDSNFSYKYLRKEDKWAISVILSAKKWRNLERSYTIGRIKRLLLPF